MEVEFGAICPYCGKGGGRFVRGIDGNYCEVDILECPHCGRFFALVWVDMGKECDVKVKYKLGRYGAYCPVCGNEINSWAEHTREGHITCPGCGEELELRFLSADEALGLLKCSKMDLNDKGVF